MGFIWFLLQTLFLLQLVASILVNLWYISNLLKSLLNPGVLKGIVNGDPILQIRIRHLTQLGLERAYQMNVSCVYI